MAGQAPVLVRAQEFGLWLRKHFFPSGAPCKADEDTVLACVAFGLRGIPVEAGGTPPGPREMQIEESKEGGRVVRKRTG